MDPIHDRGSMDPVHESGPWPRSKVGVHGPLVHVLSSPSLIEEMDTCTLDFMGNTQKHSVIYRFSQG